MRRQPSKGVAIIHPVMEALYGDVNLALKPKMEAAMMPHALTAFETLATASAWAESAFDGRRAYIRTLEDQCNPLFVQEMWPDKSGVKWDIVDMKSAHCPFMSRLTDVAELSIGFLEKMG